LAPRDERVLLSLAQARAAAGKFAAARDVLNEAINLAPNNSRAALLLVQVLLAEKVGDNQLKAALRTAVQRFSGDSRLHAQLGHLLFEQKQYDLALAELLRVKFAGELEPDLLLRLATLEHLAEAHLDAIADADAVEKLQAASESTRAAGAAVRGLSLESLGREAEALAALRRSVKLNPAAESGWIALVEVFEKRQKAEEAASAAAEGIAAIPGSSDLARKLATNLLNAGRARDATAVLVRLVASAPERPASWALLARAYIATAEPAKAVDALEKLRRHDPAFPMLHVMSAQARLQLNPPAATKALEDLWLAEKATPDDAEIFVLRAQALTQVGNFQGAIGALRRAIELRPADPALHYQLGQLYRKHGEDELAKEEFERTRFLRANP